MKTYALKMAGLLEPKNTAGQPFHVVVQRAETAVKAYSDYLAARDGLQKFGTHVGNAAGQEQIVQDQQVWLRSNPGAARLARSKLDAV